MLRWLGLATVAAGCNFSPTQGFTDGGGDADVEADAIPPAARCGSPGVVRGPFAANLASMGIVPITPERVVVDNGRLSATATNAAAVGALIRGRVDLRNSAVEVAVDQAGTGNGVATVLAARFDPGRQLRIVARDGMLIAVFSNLGDKSSTMPYDPGAHRVWRIRDDGAMLIFEASADRTTWIELLSVPTPDWVVTLSVSMYITNESQDPQGNRAIFAQLNEGTSPASWCPATSLRDDFGDGVTGLPWDQSTSGAMCQVTESGGAAVFTHAEDVDGVCYASYSTRALYDLRSNAAEITVPPITQFESNWWAFLTADTGSKNLTLQFNNGEMCALATGFASQCADYTGAENWRLAHNGNELSWQVSSDRITWSTIRTQVIGEGLESARISFGARRSDKINTPITLRVTEYNP